MGKFFTFLLSCLAFLPGLYAAPVSVVGSVVDKDDDRPVELANVAVLDADNKIVAVCATDSYGEFRLSIHKG